MPVEPRSASAQLRSIAIGLVGLLVAVVLVVVTVKLVSGRGSSTAGRGPGGGRFTVGDAAQLARNVRSGGPFLLSDLAGNGQNRPIFVSHTGDDVADGWFAFEARPPGAPADCYVQWDRARRELRAPCTGDRFSLDGDGLRQYPTEVTDAGDVVVDLRQDRDRDQGPDPSSDASS